jgi:hypothetical protein
VPHQARIAITAGFLWNQLRPGWHRAYSIPEDGPIPADAICLGVFDALDGRVDVFYLVFEHDSFPDVPQGTVWRDLPVLGPIEAEWL